MVKDAEANAAEDARRREEVEVRNNCDSLINATEQTLTELGDRVPADSKSQAQAAVDKARTALQGTDTEAIKSAMEELQQAGYKLAEIAYSQQGVAGAGAAGAGFDPAAAAAAAAAQQGAGQQDDGTIEADYEVIDPEDK
jgi:molecular chaperone DnaK